MINLYQTKPVRLINVKKETSIVKLFTFKTNQNFVWRPGQFVMVSYPGFGEAPFALCSNPKNKKIFQLAIRKVGQLTTKLFELKKNDIVYIRGPFGRGLPEQKRKKILLIAGGIGIIPLRAFILKELENLTNQIILFYGAKTPRDFLFKNEFKKWQKKGISIYLTIDKEDPNWRGYVGLIPILFDKVFKKENIHDDYLVYMCGPSVMYKPIFEKLYEYRFKEENIYLLLERRMHCGVGTCQHCAVGIYYVCKDGPVFCWKEIKEIANII
jgi:NAD(P)H-flavin reductase